MACFVFVALIFSSVLANSLAGKRIYEMIYFASSGV